MTRTVLITGAGSGLGLTISRHLWQLGYQVAMADIAIDIACEGARQIDADRRRLLPLALDIREPEHFHAALAQIDERFGGLDVLVNNAAVAAGLDMDEMTVDAWRQVLEINLDGAFALVLHAQPHLVARRGCVLHISSISAVSGEFDDVAYATSKAAIEGLSRRLAMELAPRGVRSNVIRPGLIRTEAFADLPDDFFASQLPMIPLHRFGAPEDIALAAAFLCSREASFVTGAVLTIDGGESAR